MKLEIRIALTGGQVGALVMETDTDKDTVKVGEAIVKRVDFIRAVWLLDSPQIPMAGDSLLARGPR